jgi:arsenate reductase-like glutaredoxin family protein
VRVFISLGIVAQRGIIHSMVTVYGIPNCDSVKKARDWLAVHQVAYVFHDFKKQGASQELLAH